MKTFSIIVAMDERRGIGKNGGLPWNLPSDMKFFKNTTIKARDGKRNAVIMGRKTWDSIPERFRPLTGRLNIILTRSDEVVFPQGCIKAGGLDGAFRAIEVRHDIDKIFVIGGSSVYRQAICRQECGVLYITQVKGECDCDAYFPVFSDCFNQVSQSDEIVENSHQFSFLTYQRSSGQALKLFL